MSNYQRLGSSSSRLGSFESHGVSNHFLGGLGQFLPCPDGSFPNPALSNQCGVDGKCYGPDGCRSAAMEQQVVAKTAPSAAPESSTSAKDVLTGIAAILNPLAQAGVGIYAASRGGGIQQQQQPMYIPPPPPKSNTGLIIAVVAVVVVIAMIMMMSGRK